MTCPYLLTANTPETLFLLKRENTGTGSGRKSQKGQESNRVQNSNRNDHLYKALVHFNQTFFVLAAPILAESNSILFTIKQIIDIGLTSEQIIQTVGTTTSKTEAKEHDRQKEKSSTLQ